MIETKDTTEVIKEVIENLLYDIDSLKSARWNDKHFTMFVFGDYAFLSYVQSMGCQVLKADIHACAACAPRISKKQTRVWSKTIP